MKLHNTVASLLTVAFIFQNTAHAQHIGDSSVGSIALKHAIAVYHSSMYPQQTLYNGHEYIPHNVRFQSGHAYLETDKPLQGSVTYDNVFFDNVSLMLDLIRDELIIIHPMNNFKIRLIKSRIHSFTIADQTFIHIKEDSSNPSKLAAGFYELIYNGNTALIKKRTKSIKEELVTGQRASYTVIEKDAYFLEKDNRFYRISNKKSLFNSLKDKNRELKAYYKKENLDIREEKEKAITKIAAYYDEIKAGQHL